MLEAAAAGSTGEPPAAPSRAEMARWIETLPAAEKDAYLVRFLAEEGDVLLRAELSKRFREATAPRGKGRARAAGRRTVAQLLAARGALAEEKSRKAAEQAAGNGHAASGSRRRRGPSIWTSWPAASPPRGAKSNS